MRVSGQSFFSDANMRVHWRFILLIFSDANASSWVIFFYFWGGGIFFFFIYFKFWCQCESVGDLFLKNFLFWCQYASPLPLFIFKIIIIILMPMQVPGRSFYLFIIVVSRKGQTGTKREHFVKVPHLAGDRDGSMPPVASLKNWVPTPETDL